MSTPSPPDFLWKNKPSPCDVSDNGIYEYIERIVKPIFEKVAQETPSDRVSVGGGRFPSNHVAFYCPHFYRLYFKFSKQNFTPLPLKRPTYEGSVNVTYQLKNHNSEHEYSDFCGCRITVKKNQVEVLNNIDHKKTYLIDIAESARGEVIEILRRKDMECIAALQEFIRLHGGASDFVVLKRKGEHPLMGTRSIDALPSALTFHNEICKKVYAEQKIEYYDPVCAVNHLVNSGIIEVVPSLCHSIESLAYSINPLYIVKGIIHSLADLPKCSDIISKLSEDERADLTNWVHDKFCVFP